MWVTWLYLSLRPTPSDVCLIQSSLAYLKVWTREISLSYIMSYFLFTASFLSAYKRANTFAILKKILDPIFPFSYSPYFLPFTAKLWKNCPTAISNFSNISCAVAAME